MKMKQIEVCKKKVESSRYALELNHDDNDIDRVNHSLLVHELQLFGTYRVQQIDGSKAF